MPDQTDTPPADEMIIRPPSAYNSTVRLRRGTVDIDTIPAPDPNGFDYPDDQVRWWFEVRFTGSNAAATDMDALSFEATEYEATLLHRSIVEVWEQGDSDTRERIVELLEEHHERIRSSAF